MNSNGWKEAQETVAVEESASHTVVSSVSNVLGVDSTELEPLTRTIDGDALDSIQESMGRDEHVSFRYEGLDVVVTGDGTVAVGDPTNSDHPDGAG